MTEEVEEAPEVIERLVDYVADGFSSLYTGRGCPVVSADDLLDVYNAQQETIAALEDRLQIQRKLTADFEGTAAELDAEVKRLRVAR